MRIWSVLAILIFSLEVSSQTEKNLNTQTNYDSIIRASEIVLVDLMFIGCKPCLMVHPVLNSLQKKYGSTRVSIVSLSPADQQKALDAFKLKHQLNYPLLAISYQTYKALKIESFPTLLLYKNGTLMQTYVGATPGLEMRISKRIRQLLKK